MGARPSVSTGNNTKGEGRFIAYDNGTVLDTKTNLMWAAKDDGSGMSWGNANSYCENYRGGGMVVGAQSRGTIWHMLFPVVKCSVIFVDTKPFKWYSISIEDLYGVD